MKNDVIIIGGGAAGFFSAINIAILNPKLNVLILERGKEGLQKVKISGGGRCNVTHGQFLPSELTSNYPRGEKELLGPFHQFMTSDTMHWFEERGVKLKIEQDGRVFPVSNNSQTIIDCFLNEVKRLNIKVLYNHSVKAISFENNEWLINTDKQEFNSLKILVATGSNPKIWKLMDQLNHTIVNPVPSLFSFDIKDTRIQSIPGVVVDDVNIDVVNSKLSSDGPLLITHKGMSAPSILKLSAFGALEFESLNYQFDICINFVKLSYLDCLSELKLIKNNMSKKMVVNTPNFGIPKRLWKELVIYSNIDETTIWAELNKNQLNLLCNQLTSSIFKVNGKSTFKEEFVTAGGIDLKEINFKTFESKIHNNLFFAGEVLNIDAITGGYNFQNAWTGAYIASKSISGAG
ncbi:MAG: aminoacetone oxidase family FAD-binding enzyme [Pelagibacterales bacterium]|mgnify:CR=1 FL=1|nr:aminoacetone oxidase family FAD-binding enzyme [Pelagibacterales bacterium]|tara:strand:+ start:639 stop:1853 length:1215 start_codon:yes stop_codon:yes gene_type:complete